MKPPALHDLGQLDAWVLSTYQRLERLAVPVFDVRGEAPVSALPSRIVDLPLSRLPTALPGRIGSFDDWLATGVLPGVAALDATTRLSLLFRYFAAPLRYEPTSESAVHKAVPSARCLFPVDYFLLRQTAEGITAWRYVAEHHALTPVAFTGPVTFAGNAALVAVARIWSIAEKYGEFAHFPPVLEGGHAAAQVGYLAASLGLAGSEAVDRTVGRGLCSSAFDLPLFAISLCLADLDPAELDIVWSRVALRDEGPDLAARFPRLATFHRLFDGDGDSAPPVSAERSAAGPPGPDTDTGSDFLEVMRRRTAGNDRAGTAATLVTAPADLLPGLLALWHAVASRRPRLAGEELVDASLAWLADGPVAAGLYRNDGTRHVSVASRSEFRRQVAAMLPYRGMRLNLDTLTATLVIHVDPLVAIDRLGPAALREVHLAAGAMAQDFGLAATALGLFARPVRMMREALLERALPIDGQVVYQLLCGFARRANPSTELL